MLVCSLFSSKWFLMFYLSFWCHWTLRWCFQRTTRKGSKITFLHWKVYLKVHSCIYVWIESYPSLCVILHLSRLIFTCYFNSSLLGIITFSRSSTNNSFEYPEQYCVTSKLFHFISEVLWRIVIVNASCKSTMLPFTSVLSCYMGSESAFLSLS